MLILAAGYEPRWLLVFWVICEVPYLVGFGFGAMVAYLLHSPA